jgi:hypothetical protein
MVDGIGSICLNRASPGTFADDCSAYVIQLFHTFAAVFVGGTASTPFMWQRMRIGCPLQPEFVIPMHNDRRTMHVLQRLVDVPESHISPSRGASVVLFTREVRPSAAQQFYGLPKSSSAIQTGVDARMIFHILSVEHRSAIDLANRRFHLVIGLSQVSSDVWFFETVHHELGSAKIAARTQIRRMAPGGIRVHRRGCKRQQTGRHSQSKTS